MAIDNTNKVEYFTKLITPYTKQEKKFFIDQYLRGAGNELSGKFWAEKSSSRMAFDLYSWMKDDKDIIDFEFEFLLPALASGGKGPNMDVFIETKDELIFIESKFTEKANLHYIDNGYLSPGYYAPTHGKNNMSLEKRMRNLHFAKAFGKFCNDFESTMKECRWHDGHDWFEPKQETCHILGVLFYIFNENNQKRIKGKKIRLFNIVWKMEEDDMLSSMHKEFEKRANLLIQDACTTHPNDVIDFKFSSFSVQDMLKNNGLLSPHIKFPAGLDTKILNRNNSITMDAKR